MQFRFTNQLQAIFAASTILSTLIPIAIIIILWFWARGAISSAIESIFPEHSAKIITNFIFAILAFYFLIKFLGKRA